MNRFILTVLLLSVTAIWGWTFVVVKDAVDSYGVISFLALRFLIASALLGGIALPRVTRRCLRTGGLIGIFLAGGYVLQTFGLRYTSVTNCGLVTGMFIVFVPLVNYCLFGIRTSALFWVAVALSVAGLALLTRSGTDPLNVGDLLTLGGAASYAVQISLLERFAKRHDALGLALTQVLAATAIFLIALPLTETLVWPTAAVWKALIITGVLATALCFCVQTFVQQRISAVRAAVIFTVEPVFAAFFGYWLAGDRLVGRQVLGAGVMVGAVLLAELGPLLRQRRQMSVEEDGLPQPGSDARALAVGTCVSIEETAPSGEMP